MLEVDCPLPPVHRLWAGGSMKRSELEDLIGESFEDIGLEEMLEELECEHCGELVDESTGICTHCL